MPFLECDNLVKRFGGVTAVDRVVLSIERGEILGLIGPNGAGKTTLINLLVGDQQPTDGKIIFRGQTITALPPYRRCRMGIARTFQVPKPFRSMTVRDNVVVGALFGRYELGETQSGHSAQRVESALMTSLLLERAESRPGTLSTAGLKRLEIARSLATNPELILLDEPLGGLNDAEVHEAIDLIKTVNQRGVTIVIVEHNVKAVVAICNRIIVLAAGRKLAEGSPPAVLANEEVQRAYLGDVAGAVQHHARRRALHRQGLSSRAGSASPI